MKISSPHGIDLNIEIRRQQTSNVSAPEFRQLPFTDKVNHLFRNARFLDIWLSPTPRTTAHPRPVPATTTGPLQAVGDASKAMLRMLHTMGLRTHTHTHTDTPTPTPTPPPRESSNPGTRELSPVTANWDRLPFELQRMVMAQALDSDEVTAGRWLMTMVSGNAGNLGVVALDLLNSSEHAHIGRSGTATHFSELANRTDLRDDQFIDAVKNILDKHQNIGLDFSSINSPTRRTLLCTEVSKRTNLKSIGLVANGHSADLASILNALYSFADASRCEIHAELNGRQDVHLQIAGHLNGIVRTSLSLRDNGLRSNVLDCFDGDTTLKTLDLRGNAIDAAKAQAYASRNTHTLLY